ncbi:hypothetical protein KKE68_07425 [Patescibacteria group bacterium]|nr:hypothetical protein [Patescibacteria group bacterium]
MVLPSLSEGLGRVLIEAMENASEKLKGLVLRKKQGFVGKSVNENGVLDVLDHFGLNK